MTREAGRAALAERYREARAWLLEEPPYSLPAATFPSGRWARTVASHPRLLDVGPVIVLGLLALPLAVTRERGHPFQWLLEVMMVVPLVWRRRAPLAVLSFLACVGLVQWIVDARSVSDEAFLVALYTVAAHRSRRATVAGVVLVEVGVVMASLRWSPAGTWLGSVVFLTAAAAAAALLGITLRSRRAHLAALVDKAERMELERDQQAQIAGAAERTRIAREMHDIIAHSLAVIISQADGAAAKLHSEPDRAADAIAGVAEVGRQALDETRRLLGVLRADGGSVPYAPQPSVDQLDDLVEGSRAAGLPAQLVVHGGSRPLPAGMQLAVYRIVQEALTNVLKHGRSVGTVLVEVDYEDECLQITVDDDGLRRGASSRGPDRGHGLLGMSERAAVYGGSVHAGPTPGGGWQVLARLPLAPLAPSLSAPAAAGFTPGGSAG